MYEFVTGPLAWIAFGIFFIGIIYRIIMYIRGLDWQLDRVAYTAYPGAGMKGALKSIFFWLVPFGSRSFRVNPGFTIFFFLFHIGLLIVPIFLEAHNILLEERLGFRLFSISNTTADILTVLMLGSAVFLVLRRIALSEVRILTTWYDYLVLLITVAPFFTGFIASHTQANYHFWLIAHILTGEIMLVAIPFTKLSHFVLFFMSRAQLGMDFGIKRGGMKGRGIAW
jgi:nitrate reductase gamma subunit